MSTTQPWMSAAHYQALVERDEALEALRTRGDLPGVTVCLTHFKEDYSVLSRATLSVHAQTVQPWQILVIDDGGHMSQENEDSLNSEGIPVYRVTNRGLPAARNTGLMLCRTEGIVFLDSDDALREDYIEKTLPLLQEGADVVLTGLVELGPHRNGTYNAGYDRPYDQVTEEILWTYNRFFYAALWRREVLASMGGYHPAMAGWPGVSGGYEDWTTWIDAKRRGLKFAAVDEPLLLYNTATPDSMLARAERNRDALVGEMKRHHNRA